MPVPGNAPSPPTQHPNLKVPIKLWTYRDRDGAALGHIARFEHADGKAFLPLTYWNSGRGRQGWRWKAWPAPRPLYGLDQIAGRPDAPVLVCEGEKAADAAAALLPAWVAVCSPNGALSAAKADWGPLAGREVTIWPDADQPGYRYAADVARALAAAGATSVSVIDPPAAAADGWDAADALAEGWDTDRVRALVRAAKPVGSLLGQDAGKEAVGTARPGGQGRAPAQSERIVRLAEDLELWHTPRRQPYATVPVGGHLENWAVRSSNFRRFLAAAYYDAHGLVPSGQAMEDALRIVETWALRGAQHAPQLRVGEGNGALYLDLGDDARRVVEVTAHGWRLIDHPPVKFVRGDAMRALPEPEAGASIDSLRGLVNVASDDDFRLIVGSLVGALHPDGPYPLLLINGEQGTAKSMLARTLVNLVDPRAAALRSFPRDERDLAILATNARVLAFDNISGVPHWLSDALCRLSTGGGFGTRQLHSDQDEVIFEARRPIIMNGIPDLAGRPDLGDRAISVTLSPIPPEARRTESELVLAFESARPQILGALLDAVSSALRHRGSIRIERLERMADFCLWVTAGEPGLGWEDQAFLAAYRANRAGGLELGIESDPVASAVRALMDKLSGSWEGSASELLPVLEQEITEKVRQGRDWPSGSAALSNRLRRATPMLRHVGIEVVLGDRSPTKDRKRLVRIHRTA